MLTLDIASLFSFIKYTINIHNIDIREVNYIDIYKIAVKVTYGCNKVKYYKTDYKLMHAITHDHVPVAKWLIHNRNVIKSSHIYTAIKYGNLSMFKLLLHNFTTLTDIISYGFDTHAVINGHLHILKWIYNRYGLSNNSQMSTAIKFGHVNIAQWLYDNNLNKEVIKPIDMAAHNGHVGMVDWLIANNMDYVNNKFDIGVLHGELNWSLPCTSNALLFAAITGNLVILKQLRARNGKESFEMMEMKIAENAVRSGNLNMVKYLYKGDKETFIISAIKNNKPEILKWIYNQKSKYMLSNEVIYQHEHPVYYMARCGNIDIVKLMLQYDLLVKPRINQVYALADESGYLISS